MRERLRPCHGPGRASRSERAQELYSHAWTGTVRRVNAADPERLLLRVHSSRIQRRASRRTVTATDFEPRPLDGSRPSVEPPPFFSRGGVLGERGASNRADRFSHHYLRPNPLPRPARVPSCCPACSPPRPRHPGVGVGHHQPMWRSIEELSPDVWLWIGDAVYVDIESDGSVAGVRKNHAALTEPFASTRPRSTGRIVCLDWLAHHSRPQRDAFPVKATSSLGLLRTG